MIYRRKLNTYVWHFSTKCSMWPTESFEERPERPAKDPLDLCGECTAILIKDGRDTSKQPNGSEQ
jgi:hypothetical protein